MLNYIIKILKLALNKIATGVTSSKFLFLIIGGLIILKKYFGSKDPIPEMSMSHFLKILGNGEIKSARVGNNSIYALTKENQMMEVSHSLMPKHTLFDLLEKSKINFFYDKPQLGGVEIFLISLTLSSCLVFLYYTFFNKSGFKSKKPQGKTKFDDIIGLDQAKISMKEVLQFMFSKEKYDKYGARMRKGILLYGPSGTGKTTLAKACANQANIPFFSVNAAEFCEIYVGVGPKKVRELFEKAKQSSPSIIYIDEIDAIGKRSSGGIFESSNSQKNSTVNQLLSEMDGFDSNSNVLVIASTNRLEMLDSALLRPGRFDLKIKTPLPTLDDRIKIMKLHLRNKNNSLSEEFISRVMEKMEGWSGADIENLTNEAIYRAIRRNRTAIEEEDIFSTLKLERKIANEENQEDLFQK